MPDVRTRFLADAVATATPARLLTMVYDRLELDLARAAAALEQGARPQATQHLAHAQDVVAELLASLDVEAWEGAQGLSAVYTYLMSQLIEAGRLGDAERVRRCREDIVGPLAQAWRGASEELAQDVPTPRGASGVLGVG